MLKFDFEARRVVIDPKTIQIQNLLIIWDHDASRSKDKATRLLTYIHLISQIDEEAPYYTASFSEVGPLAKRDLFGDYEYDFSVGYKEDFQDFLYGDNFNDFFNDFLEETVIQYQKAYETVDHRNYRTMIKKIDQTRELIEDTDPSLKESTVRGAVSYASNFPLLNKMIQELGPLQDAADEMRARMKKNKIKEEGVIRAGKKLSIMEERLKKAKQQSEAGSVSSNAGF